MYTLYTPINYSQYIRGPQRWWLSKYKPSNLFIWTNLHYTTVTLRPRNDISINVSSVTPFKCSVKSSLSITQLKDFLTYLQPVNIYPSVIPLGLTLGEVTELWVQLFSITKRTKNCQNIPRN